MSFFPLFLQCVKYVPVHIKVLEKLKKVKVGTDRSSALLQKMSHLKRLVSSPAFNSMTL